jgi:hypothetical protein
MINTKELMPKTKRSQPATPILDRRSSCTMSDEEIDFVIGLKSEY